MCYPTFPVRTLDGFILVHVATACLPFVVSTQCTFLVVSSWRTDNNPQGPLWKSRFGNRVCCTRGVPPGRRDFQPEGRYPEAFPYWNSLLKHMRIVSLCYFRFRFLWGFHSKPVVARGCQLDNLRSLDPLIVTSTQFTGFSSEKVELRTPHLKLGSIS